MSYGNQDPSSRIACGQLSVPSHVQRLSHKGSGHGKNELPLRQVSRALATLDHRQHVVMVDVMGVQSRCETQARYE